jgi:PTH1 family peptidyl-tRNA hydrolase
VPDALGGGGGGAAAEAQQLHLVVGLGNPGAEYAETRHNAGFCVVEALARRWGGRFRRGLFAQSETCRAPFAGRPVLLVKPMTYMNLSGKALVPLLRREGASAARLVVVHDDMDIPLGRLRLRSGGGSGGHRGVASIIASMGTDAVARVRVGIGRPPDGIDAAQYVLSPVRGGERALWLQAVELAADAVEAVLRDGLERAMERFNGAREGQRPGAAPTASP